MNNSQEELKKCAEIWYKLGWRDRVMSAEEMRCYGCVSASWCRYGMKECCENKKIENCGYCNEYPCEKIKKAFEKTEEYERITKELLSDEDYNLLKRAFYLKKENLGKMRVSKED